MFQQQQPLQQQQILTGAQNPAGQQGANPIAPAVVQQQPGNAAPAAAGQQPTQDSNAFLFTVMQGLISKQKDQELAALLNDKKVVDKLEVGILHYKLSESDLHPDRLEQAVDQLTLKFAEGKDVTASMKDLVLKPFALACSLEAATAFALLDAYFKYNYNKFSYFDQLNQRHLACQQQFSMLQGANNQFQVQQQQQAFQEYDKELRRSATTIVNAAKAFYIQERRNLLRMQVLLIGMLARQSAQGQPAMQTSQNLVREKLVRKDLPVNLAKGLIRSQDQSEFSRYCDGEGERGGRERLVLAIQEEKIEMLKLLFSIFYSEPETSKKETLVATTINYLQRSCQIDHQTAHHLAHAPQYSANESTISGLTQLTCLAMLQLQNGYRNREQEPVISKKQAHAWNLLLNEDNLSQTTGPIVLSVVAQAMEQDNKEENVKKMVKSLQRDPKLLVAITEIIRSEVFRCDELQQMNHAFYLVIYGWLKLAFRFFQALQLEEEVDQVQVLTLQVLSNPSIIKVIWAETEAGNNNRQMTLKDISHSIEIFKPFLDNPTSNVHKFLSLILVLSGNKREPKGSRVIEMLQNTRIAEAEGTASDLLAELIAYLVNQMGPLEQQHLNPDEFKMVEAVLILFAKVIKQDPLMYIRLNQAYMRVAELSHDGKLGLIFAESRGHMQFERGNNPFLTLLIAAFHSLMPVSFEYSRAAVSHLMDAFTELYDRDELMMKEEILHQLSSYVNQELGGARVVSYFGGIILEAEKTLANYKATESYLRFLTKVFKRPYPQACLPDDLKLEFERSLLANSLEQVYSRCMVDYFNTGFIDAASMGKLTTRLFKLTRALLSHFLEVPQSQKAPLCEPFPRFDLLLESLRATLNQFSIVQICTSALELTQAEEARPDGTLTTRLENKFLSKALKNRQGDSHQVGKLIKMATESIRLLNTLLELALVDDQTQSQDHDQNDLGGNGRPVAQDWTSKRCQYVRNLRCVQEFRSQVIDPTRVMQTISHQQSSFNTTATSISLQSMVAHYMLPSSRLSGQQLRTRAIDHLTLTCKLWQISLVDSVRPDLYQLLQGLGSSNQVEQLFAQQFEMGLSGSAMTLPQCLAWLDLLILAAETQPRFLEMLLGEGSGRTKKQQIAKTTNAMFKLLQSDNMNHNILEEQQRLHVKFKLTALLSSMAQKRLCIDFVSAQDCRFLTILWENVIEDECLRRLMQERIHLNGTYLEPIVEFDEELQRKKITANTAARKATNQCMAKVTICFYLQLLVSEFSRDPSQKNVRREITRIFTNEQFKTLSITTGQISPDVHQLISIMRNLNEHLQYRHDERNRDKQRQNQDMILARGITLQDQTDSPMHSSHQQDGSVYLKGSLCIDLFKIMEKRSLAHFIVNPGANLAEVGGMNGRLGSSLYVSTKELEYALRSEFYVNPHFVGQAIALCSEFNLALSVMHTDHLILKAKQDFMVSIGKITLRDSQMSTKVEQLVPLSFFPLISSDVSPHAAMNNEAFTKHSSQLTKTLIKQAQQLLSELFSRKHGFDSSEKTNEAHAPLPQNHFLSRLDQALMSNLVFTLGVISSQLSATKGQMQVDIKGDLQKLVQQEILMRMQTLVDVDACLFDPAMIAQEVSGYGGADQMAMINPAKTTTAIQQGVRHKYEMFLQLVTQCFQLCIKLKESSSQQPPHMRASGDRREDPTQRAQILDRQRIEDAYVKVLAQVLHGMGRGYFFLRGLKVFVLAVQLIDSQHREGFSTLMKKQNDQPMKIIIGKLLEKDVTHDEITTILQLLINYAMSEQGALHLSKLKVLETLFKANIMQRLNEQDLYYSKQLKNQQGRTSLQQVRNPSHVHWCQALILIRTMNDSLLENTQIEQSHYFKDLVQQLHHFKQRIPKVLHVGLSMEAQATQQLDQLGNRSILSMALLEEIELLCAIMQQVFEHGDYWAQLDYNTYCELKDYTLFSVTKLLEHCNPSSIIPASVTEHHLAKVTQSVVKNNQTNLLLGNMAQSQERETSAFQLKAEITLQKTFLSVTCSLMNILLLSKQLVQQGKFSKGAGKSDLLQTWHEQQYSTTTQHQQPQFHNYSQQNPSQSKMHQSPQQAHGGSIQRTSGVFNDAWISRIQEQGDSIVTIAFQVLLACQRSMKSRYNKLRSQYDRKEVQELYKYMQGMFKHDEWIQKEYSGGFNTHMLTDIDGLDDVLELAETSIQVSGQVSAMLLEKVREGTSNDLRFANAQYQIASAALYNTDEQSVVFMASDLMTFLGEAARECKDAAAQGAQSSSDNVLSNEDSRPKQAPNLDGHYLDKLHQFVKLMKGEPCVGGIHGFNTGSNQRF